MNRHYKRRRKKKKPNRRLKVFLVVISVLLALAVAGGAAAYYMWYSGRGDLLDYGNVNVTPGGVAVAYDNGKTVKYKGKTYQLNENIVSAALIGVDKEELGLENGVVGTAGQADVILVAAYDTVTGKTAFISVPRDSVTDVNIYDEAGKFVGIKKEQICLSYAYGDGKRESCENVIKSVRRVLCGIPVSKYAAMDLEGIAALNDSVGGITLTVLENYGEFKKGETVTLMGDKALLYVRARDTDKLDSDTGRRARQIQYVKAFVNRALSIIKSDISAVGRLYGAASEYSFTDVTLSEATYLAATALNKGANFENFETVPGEYVKNGEYAEYHINEEELFELILRVYYNEKSES